MSSPPKVEKGAPVIVIGGGLAGCEAAYQAAERGARVLLFEMRPLQMTAAHKTADLAEIVCSNSLRSNDPTHASGLLKTEMRQLRSLILATADQVKVPAGTALAVDRDRFAKQMTAVIMQHPRIEVIREEVKALPRDEVAIVATGPLTSEPMAQEIQGLTHAKHLYFYDAISPIVDGESIQQDKTFRASRYGNGADYINCPMTNEEYERFHQAVLEAEKVPAHAFERKIPYFEGCLPIEEMAERGRETLRFGPMKPVGLVDPKTKRRPYAVVQLRQEDAFGSCYNMVGFQTKLTWPEQRRVLRLIPGLEQAEFLRYGSLHRNTYLNAPLLLTPTLQVKRHPHLFFAGQITGVEGYIESAAIGLLAGINAARLVQGDTPVYPPPATAHGALVRYLTEGNSQNFQPMNINFGLLPSSTASPRRDRTLRRAQVVERALKELTAWIERSKIL